MILNGFLTAGRKRFITGTWVKNGPVLGGQAEILSDFTSSFASSIVSLPHSKGYCLFYSYYQDGPGGLAVAVLEKGQIKCNERLVFEKNGYFSMEGLPAGWVPLQAVVIPVEADLYRMYFWAHGPGVVRYLTADSNNCLNWKVDDPLRPVLYHYLDRAVNISGSIPKGLINWRPSQKPPPDEPRAAVDMISNDATNVYRYIDGSYHMYSVGLIEVDNGHERFIEHDNAAGCVRIIEKRVSEDGLKWSEPEVIIVPGEEEPPDLQFYYLSTFQLNNNAFLGFLGRYMVESQQMHLELTLSSDSKKWQRLWPYNCFPIEQGAEDAYGIYAPGNYMINDGKIEMYYTAVNYPHNHKKEIENEASGIYSATIELDRMAGVEVIDGTYLLPAKRITGSKMILPFEDKHLEHVEVCNPWGEKISVRTEWSIEKGLLTISLPEKLSGKIVSLKISGSFTVYERLSECDCLDF